MQMTKVVPLSVVGSVSKAPYVGDFEFRKVLTVFQQLEIAKYEDRLRGHSTTLDEEGSLIARMVAELSQRIVNAPEWWTNSQNGQNLTDANVLLELLAAARKVEQDYRDEMEKKAKEAK